MRGDGCSTDTNHSSYWFANQGWFLRATVIANAASGEFTSNKPRWVAFRPDGQTGMSVPGLTWVGYTLPLDITGRNRRTISRVMMETLGVLMAADELA
jgi:hypothetical protein